MIADLSTTEIGLLALGSVIIPWLIYVTKAIQALTADARWIRKVHEPDDSGLMVWKNPGMLTALHDNTEVLREMLTLLERHHASTAKAVEEVSKILDEVRG